MSTLFADRAGLPLDMVAETEPQTGMIGVMRPPSLVIQAVDRWLGSGVQVVTELWSTERWGGRLLLALPSAETGPWVSKLLGDYAAGGLQAVVLARAATDAAWFGKLAAFPHCFLRGRLSFPGYRGQAPHASVLFYLGPDAAGFAATFARWGVMERADPPDCQNGTQSRKDAENGEKKQQSARWGRLRAWFRQVLPW